MSSAPSSRHPEWFPPKGDYNTPLNIYNSLTSTKVPFVPNSGKQVKIYVCGPTVYDSAHLGHARAYMTFDILRRVLTDYFGYDVVYVINITDIDDKIILRARRNHVVDTYKKETKDISTLVKDANVAFQNIVSKFDQKIAKMETDLKTANPQHQSMMATAVQEESLKRAKVLEEKANFDKVAAALKGSKDLHGSVDQLVAACHSVLSEHLDKTRGHTITAQKIMELFVAHARKYEAEFFADMRNLGIRDPDGITRVSEYVDNIMKFVQDIIANGYAYESNGSVYFNTVKFSTARAYGKLAPWCVGNLALAAEGEGALAGDESEKKSPSDFALWKNSKPGEPAWKSPWGMGRPGWHIECSAMASDILGSNFDIHGGGEDLKFPHHDNELAQSEAQSGEKQWVNYFMHAGHLNIQGLKMSKSLKNFITISEVLKRHTARQIRMLFLLQPWDSKMNYSDASLQEAATKEKTFNEFFMAVKAQLRSNSDVTASNQVWHAAERELHGALLATQKAIHTALCDNLNYPAAINHLIDLVGVANKYLKSEQNFKALLVQRVAAFVDKILRMFGLMGEGDIGFVGAGQGNSEHAEKIADAMSRFRDMVRELSMGSKDKLAGDLLKLCDDVRDNVLPELGIRLEDVAGQPSVCKFGDPAELCRLRDAKLREANERAVSKLENQISTREKALAKWEQAAVPPADMFRSETSKYSAFDPTGKPTHDAAGVELAKSLKKTLDKTWEKQSKAFASYQEKLASDPALLPSLQAEIADLKQQLGKLRR